MADIDVEDENILTSIFKDAFPENWLDNPDFVRYLVELSSYGVQKLAQEPDRLAEEKAQILEETQDLAFHNYTTFIQTANCSKEIFQDFQIIEQHVGNLLRKLPSFSEECSKVIQKAQEISSSRRMNTLTLQRHTQLLEVLEMPQLMDTCVRNGYYEEALELAAHVRRLEKKHSTIPVLMSIVEEVKASTQLMLSQLIQQLRTNLQLPACLRVIGYLRRMEVFTEPELRIKFLQARDSWFQSILDAIPRDDPYTHITKTIEASRVHLFDIMTQFRAIFSDEDPILSSTHEDVMPESSLFHSWVVQKVSQFLTTLEQDLERGIGGRLDSLLGQCMYFGLSFSRVGADFRGLVAPIFQRAALRYFEEALKEANKKFEENMQSYNLLGLTTSGGLNYGAVSQAGQLYPPTVLLDFYPLAAYCNHVLTAFNDLRLCAPINLACQVAEALTRSLQEVNRIILAFHRAEETTFNQKEQAQFEQFCATYAADLLPYLNRCLQALFPTSQLSLMLGVSTSEIGRMGNIGLVDLPLILSQVDHLMIKVEEEPLLPESPALPTTLSQPESPVLPTTLSQPESPALPTILSQPESPVLPTTLSQSPNFPPQEQAAQDPLLESASTEAEAPQASLQETEEPEEAKEAHIVSEMGASFAPSTPDLQDQTADPEISRKIQETVASTSPAAVPGSSILQFDTIDLDSIPDAWLDAGENELLDQGLDGDTIENGGHETEASHGLLTSS